MAYTNTWSDTIPLGSADADTIDDAIQQLRKDIHDRMDDIVEDWTADPVVPTQQKRTGLELILSGYLVQPEEDDDDVSYPDKYFQSDNSATNTSRMPLPVRNDWKITKVEVLFDLSTDTSVTIGLHKTAFTASAGDTTVDSATVSASGIGIVEVFSGSETVSDSYYWLKFVGSDAGRYRVYAVKITYDEV